MSPGPWGKFRLTIFHASAHHSNLANRIGKLLVFSRDLGMDLKFGIGDPAIIPFPLPPAGFSPLLFKRIKLIIFIKTLPTTTLAEKNFPPWNLVKTNWSSYRGYRLSTLYYVYLDPNRFALIDWRFSGLYSFQEPQWFCSGNNTLIKPLIA